MSNDSAEQFKVKGNEYFRKQQFEEAISCYTKAIELDSTQVAYYTNRATAYFKHHEKKYPMIHKSFKIWSQTSQPMSVKDFEAIFDSENWLELVIEDCRTALVRDKSNLKAYYYYGVVAFMLDKLSDSWINFVECYRLAIQSQSPSFNDVSNYLTRLRVKLSYRNKKLRTTRYNRLYGFLINSLEKDYHDKCEGILKDKEVKIKINFKTNSKYREKVKEFSKNYHENLDQAQEVFRHYSDNLMGLQAIKNSRKRLDDSKSSNKNSVSFDVSIFEVPEFFVDPIKLYIFRDPVVTIYGYSYEQKPLLEYIEKFHLDPIAKKPLESNQFFPNHNLKKAVQGYLNDHKIV